MGTAVRFHPLFILVMLASIFTGYFIELITLFAVVIIHELGHAGVAGALGWRIREIELLPFGGVVHLEENGWRPARDELLIAAAGPLQNMWMIGLSWFLVETGIWEAEWGAYFTKANLTIALFNLLPVLPLDGGRIAQSAMSLLLPYFRSLQIGNGASLAISIGMIVYALLYHSGGLRLNLLLIGCFLTYSNWYEYRHRMYRFMRFIVGRQSLSASQNTLPLAPIVMTVQEGVTDAIKRLRRNRYHWIFVVDHHGRVCAALSETELIRRFFANQAPEEKL